MYCVEVMCQAKTNAEGVRATFKIEAKQRHSSKEASNHL